MKTIMELFSSPIAEVLTRTLLHSIWQSAGILIILVSLLRIIPSGKSALRYSITYGSMMLILVLSILTFIHSFEAKPDTILVTNPAPFPMFREASPDYVTLSLSEKFNHGVQRFAPYLSMVWLAGTLLFLIRLTGGWWYINRIKSKASLLNNAWTIRLRELAHQLNVKQSISLAESSWIHAPLLIGYFKPLLLIPAGFISGLSTQQIEAIFIHELTHIKRHDYLLNLIQAILESLFFFNPFIWIISRIIRTEREHCCDDAVVSSGGDTRAYVFALAQLEAMRSTQSILALSIAGSKNEILNRMKRLMEKSVNHYTAREKLMPAVLLVLGLVCASWISIHSKHPETNWSSVGNKNSQTDTIPKMKEQKSATYLRKKTIVTTTDGKPHEEIVETFEGDEELKKELENFNLDLAFDVPVPPPAIDWNPMIPPTIVIPHFNFGYDSLPDKKNKLFNNPEAWQKFEKEFQEKFSEHFSDFYEENHEQFAHMMQELKSDFDIRFNDEWKRDIEVNAKQQAEHMKTRVYAMQQSEAAMKKHEAAMRSMEEKMKRWEKDQAIHLKMIEANAKKMEMKMHQFEIELKQALIKDGYIKENESIRNMHWDKKGEIEINGDKIKQKHKAKYNAIHKKYFDKKE